MSRGRAARALIQVPVFQYKAANNSGDVVQGEMEAASPDAVMRILQSQGHIPIRAEEISPPAGSATSSPPWPYRARAGRADVDAFTRELAILLQAEVPLDKALDTLASIAERAPFARVLGEILSDVRGGAPLCAALASHERLFSRFYRDVVKAGEASGALGDALANIAELTEHARALRESIVSALLYPLGLLATVLVSMLVILAAVVPRISQMFAESGQPLPWLTRVLATAGVFVQEYWWLMALAAVGAVLLARWHYARPSSRLRWDRRLLGVPVAGPLIAKFEAARFTRTLSSLLGNGVPLADALAIARAVVANRVVAEGVQYVAEQVRHGEGLSRPFGEARVFPPLAGHLMQVGEERGNLEGMLMQLAQIYESEVRSAARRLMAVLEPALIVGLAVLVAAFMLSLIIPILSIN